MMVARVYMRPMEAVTRSHFNVSILLALTLWGCKPVTPPATTPPPVTHTVVAPTNQQAYQVKGVIKQLIPEKKRARITHEKIPGYMEAMTMLFDVKDARELEGLQTNDVVEFRMVVTDDDGWIEHVKRVGTASVVGTSLQDEVRAARVVDELKVGDVMPDYTLTNDAGRAFQLTGYRGGALGITFIFTRCPFPTFCPRMSGNFAAAERQLLALPNGPTNWHLLSLTFDTEYDTPRVLKPYATQYRKDAARWTFATGDLVDITAIGDHFGQMFWRDGAGFNHNSRTVVLDPRGRVFKVFDGNEWKVADFVGAMVEAAQMTKP